MLDLTLTQPAESGCGIADQILLKVSDAAALCGVSRKTIEHWIEREGLPAIRPQGRGARKMTMIARSDLDKWIIENRTIQREPDSTSNPTVTLQARRFVRSKK